MTRALKARVLFAILECAPMSSSKPAFKQHADAGDVEALWSHYLNSIRKRPDVKRSIESQGSASFEMLRPAVEAIYRLPTTD